MVLPAAPLLSRLDASVGVVSSGGLVSQWTDQSGNNQHAMQAASDNQPSTGTDHLGHPVVRFQAYPTGSTSGLPDWMDLAAGFTFNARDVSIFIAGRLPYSSSSAPFGLRSFAGNGAHMRWSSTSVTTNPQTLQANSRDSLITPETGPAVLGVVSDATGPVRFYTGQGQATGTPTTPVTADTDCLGATLGCYVSNTGTIGSYQTMDLYEVLVYPSALSDADAKQVRDHLAAKYGVRTTPYPNNLVTPGDSNTQGVFEIQHRAYPWLLLRPGLEDWRITNVGVSGATTQDIVDQGAAVDKLLVPGARNVLLMNIGRNDATGGVASSLYQKQVDYFTARKAAGWECWASTLIASGSGQQGTIDALNALLRGTSGGGTGAGILVDAGASKLIDWGALPQFDQSTDSNNTTFYQADNTHLKTAGELLKADLVAIQMAGGATPPTPAVEARKVKRLVKVGGVFRKFTPVP